MIKSKFANKFFIKQYIINETETSDWLNTNWADITKENSVIGFIFSVKKSTQSFDSDIETLNLYLINKNCYNGEVVNENCLTEFWSLFSTNKHQMIFKNPPIREWVASKENWCKKLANKLSNQYNMSFNEALSEVYYTIMILYNRSTIYMGNLNYIERAVNNNIKMALRKIKVNVSIEAGNAVSLSTPITEGSSDDNELTISDMIAAPDIIESKLNYEVTYNKTMELMLKKFSKREIDQILRAPLHGKSDFLDKTLYDKLRHWRMGHNPTEVTNE